MERIEKVIKGIECCTEGGCSDCPYYKNCDIFDDYLIGTLIKDVLEVLKEHEWQIKNRDESIEKAREEIKWLRGMLKEQVQEQIVHCKECKYGLYTGTEYHCDKHSGHENRLGEDQYYKEWHNGNWFCADGERR